MLWLGFIFNDTVIEITLTLAVSYIAYFTVSSLLPKCHCLYFVQFNSLSQFPVCMNFRV